MFNGIIYNQGVVTKIIKRPKGLNIFIKSNLKVNARDIGLSVACDGVCLTLISYAVRNWITISGQTKVIICDYGKGCAAYDLWCTRFQLCIPFGLDQGWAQIMCLLCSSFSFLL